MGLVLIINQAKPLESLHLPQPPKLQCLGRNKFSFLTIIGNCLAILPQFQLGHR